MGAHKGGLGPLNWETPKLILGHSGFARAWARPGLAELGNPKVELRFSRLAKGLAHDWAVEAWVRPGLAELGNTQAELRVFGFSQARPGLAKLGNPKAELGFLGLAKGLAQAWAMGVHSGGLGQTWAG